MEPCTLNYLYQDLLESFDGLHRLSRNLLFLSFFLKSLLIKYFRVLSHDELDCFDDNNAYLLRFVWKSFGLFFHLIYLLFRLPSVISRLEEITLWWRLTCFLGLGSCELWRCFHDWGILGFMPQQRCCRCHWRTRCSQFLWFLLHIFDLFGREWPRRHSQSLPIPIYPPFHTPRNNY